jgi:hypothetical protein
MSKREFGRVASLRGGRTPGRKPKKMDGRKRSSLDVKADSNPKSANGRFAAFGGNFDGKCRKYPGGSNQFPGH